LISVTVTDKKGQPIRGLQASDFTIEDNSQPKQVLAFRATTPEVLRKQPVHVIVAIDAINSGFDLVARERDELGRFLKQDGGELANPTTLAILSDTGLKVDQKPTQDGNALYASLIKTGASLRIVDRTSLGGAGDRYSMSTGQLTELATWAAALPGRKVILFISPGWPLLAGMETQASAAQKAWLFNSIIKFTNGLRETQITLYSIDPFDQTRSAPYYYQSFLKGVPNIDDAEFANLSLQVLTEHSGGSVVVSKKDIISELETAIRNAENGYELIFEGSTGDRPNEYHELRVRVDQPGAVVRTTAGYYAHTQ
jgi:VWFA-related protein